MYISRPRIRRRIVSAGKIIQSDDNTSDEDSNDSDEDNEENKDVDKNKDTDEDIDIDAPQLREGSEEGQDEGGDDDNTSDDEGVPPKTRSPSRRIRTRSLKTLEDETKRSRQPAKRSKKRGVDIKEATGDDRVSQSNLL